MADIEAVKARIRALRAKTIANGCTEQEALAAAAKVVELLQRHGLADGQDAIAEEVVKLAQKRRSPVEALFRVVAWVCHCRWHYMRTSTALNVIYLGRDPWPEVAAYLHSVVIGATGRATREFRASPQYKARRTARTRAASYRAFLDGFVHGLGAKLVQLKTAAGDDAAQRADLALARAVKIEGMGKAQPLKKAKRDVRYANDQCSGWEAGRRTNVSLGVNGEPAAPVAALPAPAQQGSLL